MASAPVIDVKINIKASDMEDDFIVIQRIFINMIVF